MASKYYAVVFRYTEAAGAYKGVVTWTTYPSKEEFEKRQAQLARPLSEVVEEGVTDERAVELVKETPVECYLNVAVAKAIDRRTGEVDLERLVQQIEVAMFAIGHSHRKTLLPIPD